MAINSAFRLLPAALVSALACGGEDPGEPENTPQGTNQPPVPALTISPLSGPAPLTVTLDASASADPDQDASTLEMRWDFDGDMVWDTPFQNDPIEMTNYAIPKTYWPRVEVRDAGGSTAVVSADAPVIVGPRNSNNNNNWNSNSNNNWNSNNNNNWNSNNNNNWNSNNNNNWNSNNNNNWNSNNNNNWNSNNNNTVDPPAGVEANLTLDTNRDGTVDASDEAGEATYSDTIGAILIANVDDDDLNDERDSIDSEVNGAIDLLDMSPMVMAQSEGLDPELDRVYLSVTPSAAAQRIRIFADVGDGFAIVHEPGDGTVELATDAIASAEYTLYIESITGRSFGWDGLVTFTLEYERTGVVFSTDIVQARTGPVIFTDDMQDLEAIYVMRIAAESGGSNLPFWNSLVANAPTGVQVYDVDAETYGYDRWIQDSMQMGYQVKPGAGGSNFYMDTHLQAERSQRPLEYLLPFELTGQDSGFFYTGGRDTSLNYGGNIEVAPTHSHAGKDYPYGRILYGGGSYGMLDGTGWTDSMNTDQRTFFDAQEIQGPALEYSSEWLAVGHIDEIFLFVPDLNNNGGKPYKVVLASPALAVGILESLQDQGEGSRLIFAGRQTQTTVDEVSNDPNLMAWNQAAQTRIDIIKNKLKADLGLTDADFREVPVLYEYLPTGGLFFSAAYNPGIQNLIPADEMLFVPDPEGPHTVNGDEFINATNSALADLGLDLEYVDIFESYHLLIGEAHCGSNYLRTPHATAWWTQE